MNLEIEILKTAILKSIDDHVAIHGNSVISLDRNFYWKITDDQMFDTSRKPDDFEIGDFCEEFSEIQRYMARDEVLGSVSMQHLAALLFWLSAKAGTKPEF